MRIGGYNKTTDLTRIGPSLLIASSLILAIRTAKRAAIQHDTASNRDLDAEVAFSIHLAKVVLASLLKSEADLFVSKSVPWYVADDEDVLK